MMMDIPKLVSNVAIVLILVSVALSSSSPPEVEKSKFFGREEVRALASQTLASS
jgi:hypothetical protein